MPIITFREKLKRINWSPFFIKVTFAYIFLATVPQFLFAIPYWLENEPLNLDLGWHLLGDHELPSALLTIFYFCFGVSLVFYTITIMDYKFNRDVREMKIDKITIESIMIPVGGHKYLVGDIMKSPVTPDKNANVLIICHGLGSTRQRNYQYGFALAFLGFAVIFYDARGHGETDFGRKWDGYYIIKDLSKVVDFIEKRAEENGDLNSKEIVAMGFSLGGAVVLNEGYLDHRIKFVIGCCTFGNYKETTERSITNYTELIIKAGYELQGINLRPSYLQSRLVSPILNSFNRKKGFFGHPVYWDINNNYRVCLAHAKDDDFVQFENFEQNVEFLGLNRENYIAFEKGNHKFARDETALIGKMLLWLWQRGF
jgi:hypothetical protein